MTKDKNKPLLKTPEKVFHDKAPQPIKTHNPDQYPPQSYTAGPCQVQASRHRSSGPNTGKQFRRKADNKK